MRTTLRRALPVLAVAASGLLVTAGPAWAGTGPAPRPAYLSVPDRLYGVAATSASNVWAVGLMPNSSLIMHWNGRRWRVSFTEPVGYFYGVSATSPNSAWAVGGTNWFSPSQTLAEHWNGSTWTQVATPSPAEGGYFTGVAATSAQNAWAVGLIAPGGPGVPTTTVPLLEHWNGRRWRQQKFTEPNDGGQFSAVAASSATNAWAVGFSGSGPTAQTLIEHWNGVRWRRVISYAPSGEGVLSGVTVISRTNAWAVGYSQSSGVYTSLILHWNGQRWRVQPSPNPTGQTNLQAVAATSGSNAWAVGFTNPNVCGYGPQCATAIFHWNGARWSVVPSPNPPSYYLNSFMGVVAISAGDAWAVGTTDYSSTLIAHWNGKAWS
jgi:hypothetical protein